MLQSTSFRDANFWKSKIWRLFLFHYPPPPDNDTLPHKHNNYSIQSLILHKVQTIAISLYECNGKIIFVSDEIHPKMPQERTFESKKIQILGETGINSKLKHRKAHNSILSWRFGDLYGRLGDCCCIRETPR